jgi:PAS domain S-box-containing protein
MHQRSAQSIGNPDTKSRTNTEIEALLVIVTEVGNIVASTRDFAKLCGYSQEIMTLQNWWADLTPPESRDEEARALGELIDSDRLQFYQKDIIRADGDKIQVYVLARHAKDLFLLELSLVRNLSLLYEGINPVCSISEALSIERAIIATDPAANLIFINKKALGLLGYESPDDLLGRPLLSCFDADSGAEAEVERTIRTQRRGFPTDVVLKLLRHDGVSLCVSIRSIPLYNRGTFAGELSFFREENGAAENLELRGGVGAMPSLLPLYSLDNLPVALCSIRPDGTLRYVNTFGRSFLSIGDEELRKGMYIFERLHEDSVERCRTILDEVLSGADAEPIVMDIEINEGEYSPAIWCFGWDQSRDGILALVIEAEGIFASSFLPGEEFYMDHNLTAREREASDLLMLGYEYKEIGERMGIGLPTVRSHIQSIYAKLGIHSRVELVDMAGRWNMENGGNEILRSVARLLLTRS